MTDIVPHSSTVPATFIVPERRRRDSIDVIDVDLLNDEEIRTSQRPFQRRRLDPPEFISLTDSDEEDQQVASGGVRRQVSRQRLHSPPAPPQDNRIPPVPAVPRRFSAHLSHPVRRRAPPAPSSSASTSGIVRPNTQPFSFETNISSRTGRRSIIRRPRSPPLLAAAPSSHHVPAMGLGGALISSHRASEVLGARERQQHDGERGSHRRQSATGLMDRARSIFSSAGRRLQGVGMNLIPNVHLPGGDYDRNDILAIQLLFGDGEADDALDADIAMSGHRLRRFAGQEFVIRSFGRGHGREDVDYKPSYTHPLPPEQGFTFDFTNLPPSPAPSTTSLLPKFASSPVDPIVIPDDNEDCVSCTDTKSNQTGAPQSVSSPLDLQCSTLLVCVRCFDPLVLGGAIVAGGEEEERKRKVWALRCGHLLDGKCLEEISRPSVSSPPPVDVKGKGKAKEVQVSVDDCKNDRLDADPDENSMRSRLRPRTQRQWSTSDVVSPSWPSPPSPHAARFRSRRRSNKIASPKAKAKIEARFEWVCPVAGCAREHTSVKTGGVWGMDQDRVDPSKGRSATCLFV